MTTSLPELLTSDDLPLPELQALALDGDVFRLGQVFCSVAEHDVPSRRAAALAASFGHEFVVARATAAWVWGGLASAPATPEGFRAVFVDEGVGGTDARGGRAQTGRAQGGRAQTGGAQGGRAQGGRAQTGGAQGGRAQGGRAQTGRARATQWRDSPAGMRASEVVLDRSDVVEFGPVRVTTPLRTIVDLARGGRWSSEEAVLTRRLAREHSVSLGSCVDLLERRKKLPYKRTALARLADVFAC